MESQQEMQQMAYFLQFAEEQLKELDIQRQVMDNGIQDISSTLYTIEQLEREEPSHEGTVNVLMPIGGGAHLKTTMARPAGVVVPIGARYHVEQDYENGKSVLIKQREKMEKTRAVIEQRIKQLVEQTEKIRPVFDQRMAALEQGQGQGQVSRPQQRVEPGNR